MTNQDDGYQLVNAYKFRDTDQRDRVLSEAYPERECTDIPGTYFLPNGNSLVVYLNEAWEYSHA